MKKLSIEQKATRYDLAIEAAKSIYNNMKKGGNFGGIENLEVIFPELKESEDERIRQDIITTLSIGVSCDESALHPGAHTTLKEAIAWLEKQGQTFTKKDVDDAYLKGVCDTKQELEKQGENKPTDKVEPKFKVGDWITFTRKDGTREVLQVSNIIDGRYYFNHLLHGSWSVKECNEKCHLWNIQDAKDGDVLAAHECIVLFKEIDGLNIKCHCTYHFMNNPSFYVNTLQNKSAFHPATKEQRDLLFQEMKKAGYKWDSTTKILNLLL